MMRQMRENTKWIMIITALAFTALMVFEWGMDATGQSSGGLGQIGRVNGDPVMLEAYNATLRQLYDQAQGSQEDFISSQQNAELEDQAFEAVVDQILVGQELRRRGITVTGQEISEAAQFSPPDYLVPQFLDDTGGLDLASYQTFLSTLPPEQLLVLEAYYRSAIPRTKLLRQVATGIYPPDAALWQQWKDQNELSEIRFVPLDPANRYEDSEFTVSQDEIADYYEENSEEFEIPARATIKFVVLDKTPTAADTAASRERADSIRQEIVAGADFGELAQIESSDQGTAALGGDLGVFPPGRMVAEFDSAVFSSSSGDLTEPIQTSFGFHLIEVTDLWGADSAQARHILLPIERTDDSEIALLMVADSIEDLGEAMALDEAAAALGLSSQTTDIALEFPFIAGAGQISEGADWAFEEASPGDVSPHFETSTAFYALELVNLAPEGVLPLENASAAIESTLLFDLKVERGREEAQSVVDRVRSGEALVNIAADMGLEVRTAGPFSREDFVPGVGRYNAVVGAAFGLEVGLTSDVISTTGNHYIVDVLDKTEADSTVWLGQLSQQRQQMASLIQQQRLQEWLEALRNSARIVDNRDEVFAPQDENAVQMPMVF